MDYGVLYDNPELKKVISHLIRVNHLEIAKIASYLSIDADSINVYLTHFWGSIKQKPFQKKINKLTDKEIMSLSELLGVTVRIQLYIDENHKPPLELKETKHVRVFP